MSALLSVFARRLVVIGHPYTQGTTLKVLARDKGLSSYSQFFNELKIK